MRNGPAASQVANLVNLIDNQHAKRSASDGLTDEEYFLGLASLPPAASKPQRSLVGRVYHALRAATSKLASSKEDTDALWTVIETAAAQAMGYDQDDRNLMLEKIVTALALQRPDSRTADIITNGLVNILYQDLDHPPRATLSKPYSFRTVDGSGTSIINPSLGAGYTPYARSVSAMTPYAGARPEPGLVFDMLMRRDICKPHPAQISSLLFSFANMIIHDIFNTKMDEPEINQHSSYLDLQVIYGKTEEEMRRVRTGSNGLIHPDTFADARIAMMPPSTAALVILFSRHHNYVANRIRAINERGTYRSNAELHADPVLRQKAEATVERLAAAQREQQQQQQQQQHLQQHEPVASSSSSVSSAIPEVILSVEDTMEGLVQAALKAQDDEIFGRSRVVNCGFFVACILRDYIPAILNQTACGWYLDPLKDFHNAGPKVPRGAGNVVSAEFSHLYRWHAAISASDEQWLNDICEETWPGVRPEELTHQEFITGARKLQGKLGNPKRPDQWTVHGWQRDATTGKFDDWTLADTIIKATKEVAGALGARNNPAWMRIIDIMGQETARNKWGLCSLNEFRRFLGLKTYSSFKEWNSDPEISEAAEMLYSHIDNLELFPGLQAEETKQPGPGAGLCPGYTTSRAILSDATALVRGDRFLTIDMSPVTCSTWGYSYGQTSQPGAYNGIIGKLFFNTLPNIFTYNSSYALFPFVTPKKIRGILRDKGVLEQYNLDEPRGQLQNWHGLDSYAAVSGALRNSAEFGVPYKPAIEVVAQGQNYVMGMDDLNMHAKNLDLLKDLAYPTGWQRTFDVFFRSQSARLLREKSMAYTPGTRIVDVVKEVANVVPMLYAAQRFGIPLRDQGEKVGFSVQEFTQQLQAQFALIFDVSYSFSGAATWEAREASAMTGKLIEEQIRLRWKGTSTSGSRFLTNSLARFSDLIGGPDEIRPSAECEEMYRKLHENEYSLEEAISYVHGLFVSSVPTLSHSISLLLEFYLREENAEHKEAIVALSRRTDPEARALLRGYVSEAIRLNGMAPVIPRTVLADVEIQDGNVLKKFKKGDGVMCSQKHANLDPVLFENPHEVNPTRPNLTKALNFGTGMHECLGAQMAYIAMPAVLRAVFSLPNVRLAPGKAGKFETVSNTLPGGTAVQSFVTPTGREWPFATNLKLLFDDPSSGAEGDLGQDGDERDTLGRLRSSRRGGRAAGGSESLSGGSAPSRTASLRQRWRSVGGGGGSVRSSVYFDRVRPALEKSSSTPGHLGEGSQY
ncbi:hypothetical protein OC842_005123 [Tilletia horrida]|uniref:linoleate 8R-lipoxygenase n=1 Tax=Tilletia horrida TaxID=155126 RepID=A0AAN6G9P4_9BASI|nr:hypothetical protein OC842_005123 [Tilletia horrida]